MLLVPRMEKRLSPYSFSSLPFILIFLFEKIVIRCFQPLKLYTTNIFRNKKFSIQTEWKTNYKALNTICNNFEMLWPEVLYHMTELYNWIILYASLYFQLQLFLVKPHTGIHDWIHFLLVLRVFWISTTWYTAFYFCIFKSLHFLLSMCLQPQIVEEAIKGASTTLIEKVSTVYIKRWKTQLSAGHPT